MGAFTFPVTVEAFLPLPSLRNRKRREVQGEQCSDEIFLARSVGAVGGGFVSILTIGIHPGVVAEQNREALFALTCRLEKAINATTHILRQLQSEIEDLNQIAAANRLALDYLLAKSGGFCKIVPEGNCRVKFHDLNNTIEDELPKLQALINDNQPSQNPWEWMWSWVPGVGWLHSLLTAIAVGGLVFLILLCITPCCISLVRGMVARSIKNLTETHEPWPPLAEEEHEYA